MRLTCQHGLHRRPGAAIRNLGELHAGGLLEQHRREVERAADADMRSDDRAWPGLRCGDQAGHRIGLHQPGVGEQHGGEADGQRDRRKVGRGIEGQVFVKRRIDRICGHVAEQQGVAVRLGARDIVGAEIARAARLVLDHYRLADQLRHLRPDQSREEVGAAAGRPRHDQLDLPFRVGPRRGRPHRERCRAANGCFHDGTAIDAGVQNGHRSLSLRVAPLRRAVATRPVQSAA
jgi:hypothetical protein